LRPKVLAAAAWVAVVEAVRDLDWVAAEQLAAGCRVVVELAVVAARVVLAEQEPAAAERFGRRAERRAALACPELAEAAARAAGLELAVVGEPGLAQAAPPGLVAGVGQAEASELVEPGRVLVAEAAALGAVLAVEVVARALALERGPARVMAVRAAEAVEILLNRENGLQLPRCCVRAQVAELQESGQARELLVASMWPKRTCARCSDCSRNLEKRAKIRNRGWMCRHFSRG
jgi:hypothetical protein